MRSLRLFAALRHVVRRQTAAWICATATFALLIPANLLPLMQVSVVGMTRHKLQQPLGALQKPR